MSWVEHSPASTRWGAIGRAILALGCATPTYGAIPQAAWYVERLTGIGYLHVAANLAGTCALGFLGILLASHFLPSKISGAPAATISNYAQPPKFTICGMEFTLVDLYTNVLCTGKIGSGKTSVFIWDLMDQLFSTFSHEVPRGPKDLFAKLGGLASDVKGDFFEAVLWFAHAAKRNILEDVKVIRPKVRIPVAKFVDERGYVFFLSGLSTSWGSEFGHFIAKFRSAECPSGFPMDLATKPDYERKPIEEAMQHVTMPLNGHRLQFVGWRWEGESLVRVSHTPAYKEVAHVLDPGGQPIRIAPPQSLRFVELLGIDNGLRFNLVNPRLSAAEVAKRLVNIGKLVDGGKGGGNEYWDRAAARMVAMCIEGWRLVNPTREISGPDILRMTSQKDAMKEITEGLKARVDKLKREVEEEKNPARAKEMRDLIQKCDDIRKYFTDSWEKLEPKTKSITESVIQNMFGEFITDGALKESFCSPTTFTFEDCVQKGTFFCFVAGREYEALSKVMATALKMQFQSVMLERPSCAHLDKLRSVALIIDECQAVAVAGGSSGSGDEHFMSLSRQSRVINVNATQSDASLVAVIGKENADVYLQQYGGRVWFQNGDLGTNERASKLCGQVHKERLDLRGKDFDINTVTGTKAGGEVKQEKDFKKVDRYSPDDFAALDVFESVTLNMGQRGKGAKVKRNKNLPHHYSSDANRKNVEDLLRWYIQAYVEQLAFHQNQVDMFSHIPVAHSVPVPPAAPTSRPGGEAVTNAGAAPQPTIVTPAPAPPPPSAQTAAIPPNAALQQMFAPSPLRPAEAPTSPSASAASPAVTPGLDANATPSLGQKARVKVMFASPTAIQRAAEHVAPATPLASDTAAADAVGPAPTYNQLLELQRFFSDPEVRVARVAQVLESFSVERIINPQLLHREQVQGRRGNETVHGESVALTGRSFIAGNTSLAPKHVPILPVRKEIPRDEPLDLANDAIAVQIPKIERMETDVEARSGISAPLTPAVSPEEVKRQASRLTKVL